MSSDNDTHSVSIGGDSIGLMNFAGDCKAVLFQCQLAREGLVHEIRLTAPQREAVEDFRLQKEYPAFTRINNSHHHYMMAALKNV